MSLLEDVFLEDEAGEAQDLERIIEGDEYDERPRSRSDSGENSEKEDEAEEAKRRVDPANTKTKRVIRNPRFVLNPARLTGPRGMQVLPEHFKHFKFKGKGYEREDLDILLKKLEHWAYRLYPKFKFEDCLKKIETLGKKRAVSVHLTKLRLGMITSEETVVQQDSSEDESAPAAPVEEDEFDKLLQQQIDIARATPGPGSLKKTPINDRTSLMPKAISSPSINNEQRERMLLNRKKAEERRLAKLKQNTSQENTINITSDNIIDDNSIKKKHNKSVIDSDDDQVSNTDKDKGNQNYINKRNTESTDSRNKVNMSVIDSDDDVMDNVSKKPANSIKSFTIALDTENVETMSLESDVLAKKLAESGKCLDTHETVEIDDGFVVSNKYVPAKKHNRSIIDSSDDDNDALVINEQVTIDVSKSSKNNVLDSFDDNDMSRMVNNESLKINKSNVIDSSDSGDEIVMNESTAVAQKRNKVSKSSKKNALEISDDDDINPNVDFENRKKIKSNAIDSSDSEDEIAMDESISVDIHSNKPTEDSTIASKVGNKGSKNSNTASRNSDIESNNGNDNTSNDIFDNLKTSEENDVTMKDVIEKQTDNQKENDSSNIIDLKTINTDEISIQDAEIQADRLKKNLSSKPINYEDENSIEVLSENTQPNEVLESNAIEDTMDVDFSGDF